MAYRTTQAEAGFSLRNKKFGLLNVLGTVIPMGVYAESWYTDRAAYKEGSAHGFFPKPLFRFCTRFLLHSTGIYKGRRNIFGAHVIPPTNGRTRNFAYKLRSI